MTIRQVALSGLEALGAATELLHRIRLSDPGAGTWEAADLQWWWRTPRRSDGLDQAFWTDDDGPVGAAVLTEWKNAWGLDVIVAAEAPSGLADQAWRHGIERGDRLDVETLETQIRDDDDATIERVRMLGFEPTDEGGAEAWLDASLCPTIRALPDGFVLVDRAAEPEREHWMVPRSGPAVGERLREVPLYDPALDLAILAPTGEVAAYALFWVDPVTHVGLVEPVRTEERWQRRGLARTMVAEGVNRLVSRGATRIKVGYESPEAAALYLGAGFRTASSMTTWVRRRAPRPRRSGRRARSVGTSLGALMAGVDAQIFRSTPPAHELVREAEPDGAIPAGGGNEIVLPPLRSGDVRSQRTGGG